MESESSNDEGGDGYWYYREQPTMGYDISTESQGDVTATRHALAPDDREDSDASGEDRQHARQAAIQGGGPIRTSRRTSIENHPSSNDPPENDHDVAAFYQGMDQVLAAADSAARRTSLPPVPPARQSFLCEELVDEDAAAQKAAARDGYEITSTWPLDDCETSEAMLLNDEDQAEDAEARESMDIDNAMARGVAAAGESQDAEEKRNSQMIFSQNDVHDILAKNAQDQHEDDIRSCTHSEEGPTDIEEGGSAPNNDGVIFDVAQNTHINLNGDDAIHTPDFPDEGSDNHGEGNNDQEDEIVFEGYVPEPTPEERMQRRVQDMIESAITLDASAVRKIEIETTQSVEHAQIEEQASSIAESSFTDKNDEQERHYLKPFTVCVFLTLLLVGGSSLGIVLGRSGSNDSHDPPLSVAGMKLSCIDRFSDRYNHVKLLVSNITTAETLANITSPQRRALEWIICEDQISSKLINQKDPLTDILPKQAHGTQFEDGDSGEAQVLRRYALATFFMATSEQGPWEARWNFLSPDKHECGWHQNKTRYNFPFQEYDPVGFVCTVPGPVPWGGAPNLMLDDEVMVIGNMYLNFRIPNNLKGILPPEIGFLDGLTHINLEDQKELHGSIPSTIGNLINLDSISILFAGPDFGGLIPPSLFTISSLMWLTWKLNEGVWELPSFAAISPSNSIAGIQMTHTGLSGTVPAFISELTSLSNLDFTGNNLENTIPDTFDSMVSLVYISMYDNNLNGTLPQSLGQLSSLDAMVLGKNNFEGSLPTWLGNFSNLRVLDLSYNNFEGLIPTEFSRLSSLEHVSLQYNFNLNGSISAFEPLESLISLLLYENSFSSTIPSGLFSNPAKPIYADFGHNHFIGKLPPVFSERASNTSYLSIMQNDLDANSVNDVACEEVPVLFADCSSCSCCNFCCSEDSTDEDDRSCNFDLDFHRLVGLECGGWWFDCLDNYYDALPLD